MYLTLEQKERGLSQDGTHDCSAPGAAVGGHPPRKRKVELKKTNRNKQHVLNSAQMNAEVKPWILRTYSTAL